MNVLYGIQGTGHGHISRAREMLPLLIKKCSVDILISGYNYHMQLDEEIHVTHKRGLSLAYDLNGGISYLKTAFQLQPMRFLKDIQSVELSKYDVIISDFEPVTAWAAASEGRQCIGMSHQASFQSDKCPRPQKKSAMAEGILKHFAPCTQPMGFHFLRYDDFIEPPNIRQEILNLTPVKGQHITVYLPAFDHETLTSIFNQFPQTEWHIFSQHCSDEFQKENVLVKPVGNRPFLKSLENCLGVVTSAGFETCAEAMYLRKKLLVIPIRNQYEQLCNAAALGKMGIPVIYKFNGQMKNKISDWLENSAIVPLPEIADSHKLADQLLNMTFEPVH